MRTADLAIVNLETALTTRGTAQQKTFVFRSPPSFADTLGHAGVDVVSLANNHVLDYGPTGLSDTLENLRGAGVETVGAGANLAEALRPVFIATPGACVAVLAASQIIPSATWVATPGRSGIASAGRHVVDANSRQVANAVTAARRSADVVIVVMHWGIEGDPCPSAAQIGVGRLLQAAGATAVLGAHPHVLQPLVPGTDASGAGNLVAYSLGNFIWDPRAGATAQTGVVELRFSGPALTGFTFHPHRLDANGWARAVDPTTRNGREIVERVSRSCPEARGAYSGSFPNRNGSVTTTTAPAA